MNNTNFRDQPGYISNMESLRRGDILEGSVAGTIAGAKAGVRYLVERVPSGSFSGEYYGLLELKTDPESIGLHRVPRQWWFSESRAGVEDDTRYRRVGHIDLPPEEIFGSKTLLEEHPGLRDHYADPETLE